MKNKIITASLLVFFLAIFGFWKILEIYRIDDTPQNPKIEKTEKEKNNLDLKTEKNQETGKLENEVQKIIDENNDDQEKNTEKSELETENLKIKNPEKLFCEENGGKIEVIKNNNQENNFCVFSDDQKCEEWDFFNGKCGQENITVSKEEFWEKFSVEKTEISDKKNEENEEDKEKSEESVKLDLSFLQEKRPSWKIGKKIEIVDCQFSTGDDKNMVCGFLTTPENYKNPDKEIKVHFAVLLAQSKDREYEPIFYLAGGPGTSPIVSELSLWQQSKLRKNFDIFLIDQRGTGYSQPALECPGYNQNYIKIFGMKNEKERSEILKNEIWKCRAEYEKNGINVFNYRSSEIAADIDVLRQEMGFPKINLLGVSYGTRLALTFIRDFPDSVRNVILDSVLPIEKNFRTDIFVNSQKFLEKQFNLCESDPDCQKKYPDLEKNFFALLEKFTKKPQVLSFVNPSTFKNEKIWLDGSNFIAVFFRIFSTSSNSDYFREIVDQISKNNFTAVISTITAEAFIPEFVQIGMHISVDCAEELPFEKDFALGKYQPINELLKKEEDFYFLTCQDWGFEPEEKENLPVINSDIPVLIFSGEDDFLTPPEYGQAVADNFEKSQHIIFPQTSHGAFVSWNDCAPEVMIDFFRNPEEKINQKCF